MGSGDLKNWVRFDTVNLSIGAPVSDPARW